MKRKLSRVRPLSVSLRASAVACLLLACRVCGAAAPAPGDDPIAALQSAYARAVARGPQADLHRELVATVLNRVERAYATPVDLSALAAAALEVVEPLPAGQGEPAEVFRKAINAALRTLDTYSRYLDARSHSNERAESSGSFVGLGLTLESSGGAVRVVAPLPDTPAARAGVQAGDFIVRVDDEPLSGSALAEAIARMRGQAGTSVSLTIRRAGLDQEFTVSLTRDTIRRQVLRWSMEDEVLVLRLGGFTGSTAAAVERAIAQATATATPRAVVLDLRGNPGGLLREAVQIADAFLTKGEIVSLRGRTPSNQRSWQADANEILAGVPMLVLIDKRSASASELVAAALQENGRAQVMGQRSYGKGTVQSTYSLGDDKGAIKLTTAVYHGPSGRTVQRTGVAPDIELVVAPSGDPAQAQAQPEAGQPALSAVRVEQGRCASPKAADPALTCAVAYLRAGTVGAFVESLAARRD
jgi:carboxyl-terminal processing protease